MTISHLKWRVIIETFATSLRGGVQESALTCPIASKIVNDSEDMKFRFRRPDAQCAVVKLVMWLTVLDRCFT